MRLRLGKNQKVIRIDNDELIVKNYPKNKQSNIQQAKIKQPNCPNCKKNKWLETDKSYHCKKL